LSNQKAAEEVLLKHSDQHCFSWLISPHTAFHTYSSISLHPSPRRDLKLIISSKCYLKSGLVKNGQFERLSINLMTSVDGRNDKERSRKRWWICCTAFVTEVLPTLACPERRV
jgi:hypothetical protein